MTIKPIILITILTLSMSMSLIENPCGIMYPREGDGDWGTAAYFVPDTFLINLYKDTKGSQFGTLDKFELLDMKGKPVRVDPNDYDWIGFSGYEILKAKQYHSTEFIKILWHSIEGGVYVKKKEFESLGATLFTYKELLLKSISPKKDEWFISQANIGVNLNKNCLNLRTLPTSSSSEILCIPSNDWSENEHTHIKILSSKGDWLKVKATTYIYDEEKDGSGDGCGFSIKNIYVGWLKGIDENGFPNIWFSVTAY